MEVRRLLSSPAIQATWLRNILGPAAAAAGITNPRGVDFVPMRRGLGGYSPGNGAPRQARIALSSRAEYWTPEGIVLTYCHEAAHAEVEVVDPGVQHQHDGCFALVYACFLFKLDLAQHRHEHRTSLWIESLDMYDLRDAPEPWKDDDLDVWYPRTLAWVLRTAGQLVDRGLDSREIAVEAVKLYARQVQAWKREAQQQKARVAAAERLQQELANSKAMARLWMTSTGALAVLLGLVVLVR